MMKYLIINKGQKYYHSIGTYCESITTVKKGTWNTHTEDLKTYLYSSQRILANAFIDSKIHRRKMDK